MTTLTCPKCRRGLADDALDAGQCPLCGFPLDGPVVLVPPASRGGRTRLLVAGAVAVVLAGAGTLYALNDWSFAQQEPLDFAPKTLAWRPVELQHESGPQVPQLAPFPHEPKHAAADPTNIAPPPPIKAEPPGPVDMGQPPVPVVPVVVVEPPPKKKAGPRPIGVVMKVNPKIEPKRQFDHPDDTAAVPDLNTGDHVTLTGRVRVLKLGSVNGKAVLDASGLVAEEVKITGDLGSDAQVRLNAPNGTVTVGGFVAGAAKLSIAAPGGEVIVAESGRVSGGSVVVLTAKRLEVKCPMSGNARVTVTLTTGGALKLTLTEEGATVTYRKSAPNDPPLTIEKGLIRGGARVVLAN